MNSSEFRMLSRNYKATSHKEMDCVYCSWELLPGIHSSDSLPWVEVVPLTQREIHLHICGSLKNTMCSNNTRTRHTLRWRIHTDNNDYFSKLKEWLNWVSIVSIYIYSNYFLYIINNIHLIPLLGLERWEKLVPTEIENELDTFH